MTARRRRLGQLLLGPRVDALGVRAAGDAGVVDPDVDRAELRLDLASAASTAALSLTSALTASPPPASVAVSSAASSSMSSTATLAPSSAEADADRLADPRAAAGDDGDLSLERH